MLHHSSSSRGVMPAATLLSLLGALFCIWSASGNAINLCVTAGCALFQDVAVAGISMWWFGAGAFAALFVLGALGAGSLGVLASGLCLFLDVCLLLIMLLTVPCVGCLFAALLFALTYLSFRCCGAPRRERQERRSVLLWVWLAFFVVNVGAIVRAEMGTWALHGPEDAAIHIYFSPSCPVCREGVEALSGRVDVAFYPLAEKDDDVGTIVAMTRALANGSSVAGALRAAGKEPVVLGFLERHTPGMLWLRFRLLCNKAHVFAAGGQSVPFLEYHGLPASLPTRPAASRPTTTPPSVSRPPASSPSTDYTLPVDTGQGQMRSCGGRGRPCP